jgi:hypothetical protein
LPQGCAKTEKNCRFRHTKVYGAELENLKKMVFRGAKGGGAEVSTPAGEVKKVKWCSQVTGSGAPPVVASPRNSSTQGTSAVLNPSLRTVRMIKSGSVVNADCDEKKY